MAKSKRMVVGSVLKGKPENGGGTYVKLRGDTAEVLSRALLSADKQKGLALKVESKKQQLESLDSAIKAGKLSGEIGELIRERINKIPDYVAYELVLVEKQQ